MRLDGRLDEQPTRAGIIERDDDGPMMWQDPDSMRATCEHWMSTGPHTEGGDAQSWCSQMVDWMSQEHGDWDNWMNGPMMGGP